MIHSLVILFSSLFCQFAYGAPIPGTSSSEFLKSDLGLFRSPLGFSIHAGNTAWIHAAPPENNNFISTIYKAPYHTLGVQPSLTVRVDQLSQSKPMTLYMSKWLKDYPRLGFEVLGSKKVQVSGKRGFLLDLLNKKSQKQLRQVVFVKNKKAVILTCRDHRSSFNKTVKDCNQIIRNFDWL